MKAAFLIVVTSPGRVRELWALMADFVFSPNSVFHKDKIPMRVHPKFVSKLVLDFHINQSIHLPALYPKFHSNKEEMVCLSLKVHRALTFLSEKNKIISEVS